MLYALFWAEDQLIELHSAGYVGGELLFDGRLGLCITARTSNGAPVAFHVVLRDDRPSRLICRVRHLPFLLKCKVSDLRVPEPPEGWTPT